MSEAKMTTDHGAIRRWIEERGGRPVSVEGTERSGDPAGVLRIDFPGHGAEEGLTELSWDEFFAKFEKEKLAFLHQDETKGGAESRFFKFVQREAKH